jgi:hypothetical protein
LRKHYKHELDLQKMMRALKRRGMSRLLGSLCQVWQELQGGRQICLLGQVS